MLLNENDIATATEHLDDAHNIFRELKKMLNPSTDAREVIAKINECSRRLERASFALMVSTLQGNSNASDHEKQENIQHLERLFLHLN